MKYINKIAFNLGIRGEQPNKDLAKELYNSKDKKGISEIAEYLFDKNKSISSDCIAVLYHVGYLDPELISEYVDVFIQLLSSKINRMVWGCMIALSTIASIESKKIYKEIDMIIDTIKNGTLITEVWGIVVLTKLSIASKDYKSELFPILCDYLKKCRAIDFSKRLEAILPVISEINDKETIERIITSKKSELSDSQNKKLQTILKKYNKDQDPKYLLSL